MRAAIAAGAAMINDVRALQEPGALEAVARSERRGLPDAHAGRRRARCSRRRTTTTSCARCGDFLLSARAACEAAGIARDRIVIDPGFGFGKTLEHNLELLRRLDDIARTRLSGARGPVAQGDARHGSPAATSASAWRAASRPRLIAVVRGASIVRVHDVRETVDALTVWQAIGRPIACMIRTREQRYDDMTTKIFRHRRRSRPRRQPPDHAGSRPAARLGRGPRARAERARARRAARRADRQGHAHLRLHARGGARGGPVARRASTCYLCGPLPTPAVAYLTRALRLSAGIVISASHNPLRRQRHQVLLRRGREAAGRRRARDRARAWTSRSRACRRRELGKARRVDDAAGRYIEFCKSTFPAQLDLRGLRDRRRLRATARRTTSRRTCSTSSAPT